MVDSAAHSALLRLRKRSEFLKVAASGCKIVTTTMIMQAARTSHENDNLIRIGFTVTKRCGGAVIRNRIKRRLRAAAQDLLPDHGQAGVDYVLIGRHSTHDAPYEVLQRDLRYALKKMPEKLEQAASC